MGDRYRPPYSPGGYTGYAPRHPPPYSPGYGYPQSPPLTYPLPPHAPPPGLQQPMYHFGHTGALPNQFGFQANSQLPQYPTDINLLPPPPGDRYRPGHGRRGGFRPREPRPRIPTAERPLLKLERGNTPDQMAGMDGESGMMPQRFRNVENMSESEEEDMVESDQEDTGTKLVGPEKEAPKWSNAELYTAAPPFLDGSRKKKDVVKMIRKARLAAENGASSQLAPQADDFISFGFEDEEKKESELHMPPANAPSGPRSLPLPSVQKYQPAGPQATEANIAERLRDDRKRKRSPGFSGDESYGNLDIEIPVRKHPRVVRQAAAGHILDIWEADDQENPCPWVKPGKHNFTENAGFRLHKEICDFYDYVKPRDFEREVRQDLLERTREAIKAFNPTCEVESFGSFAADLYLPNADMDVVVISQAFRHGNEPFVGQSSSQLHRIAERLVREGLAHPASIDVVAKAKVPLVKFVDKTSGIRVDMSFENITGIKANRTFRTWKDQFSTMPIIVTVIKQFLLMRGLNEVVNGGLGGFAVTCLVTSLLQHMSRVQSGQLVPEQHLGEILLEFLDLYGNLFDLSRTAIAMNPPGFVSKAKLEPKTWMNKMDRLYIIDPNNAQNDITGGSSNVSRVFEMFAVARAQILVAMRSDQGSSLLGTLLGGNYSRYVIPRERCRRLYQKLGLPSTKDGENKTAEPLKHSPKLQDMKLRSTPDQDGKTKTAEPSTNLVNQMTPRSAPDQEDSTKMTEKAFHRAEGKARATGLMGLFPEFVDLIPSVVGKQKVNLIKRALRLKRVHPEIKMNKNSCNKVFVQELERKYLPVLEESEGSDDSCHPEPKNKRYNKRSSKAKEHSPKGNTADDALVVD